MNTHGDVRHSKLRSLSFLAWVLTLFLVMSDGPRNAWSRNPPPPRRPLSTGPAALRWRVLSARPLRLFYYADDAPSFQSLEKHWREIALLAPQCYWIRPSGQVMGNVTPRVSELAKRHHIPLMPLVFNSGFDRESATQLLRSAAARARLTANLSRLARQGQIIGIQIDLENIAPEDRTNFSDLVREAARALHSEGKLLSVALPPKRILLPATPGAPVAGTWAAAFDYRTIGRYADFVTVMAYDQHGREGPPGPIAGYDWVKQVVDYATRRIPAQKILLGIPLYGREWAVTRNQSSARTITLRDVGEILSENGVQVRWDAGRQSPWFTYRHRDTRYDAWFENARSLWLKLALIGRHHLRGFAAWRLGSENSSVWTLPMISGMTPRHRHRRSHRIRTARASP
jgi:spore germination protein YaaH